MKHIKKLASLVLAVVMILALATTAFAATVSQEGLKITITSEYSGHTYKAYQIFSGNVDNNTATSAKKLSNIQWASGVDGTNVISELYKITAVKAKIDAAVTAANDGKAEADQITYTGLTANQIADILTTINDADTIRSVAGAFYATKGSVAGTSLESPSKTYTISNLKAGYYLVVDETSTATTDDAYSALILNVVGDVNVTAKTAKPTVDKQVQDEADDKDTNSTDTDGWGETADHAINEVFQFKLIATLPADSDYAAYETYKVQFNDTMSEGVAFNEIVSVTIAGRKSDNSEVTASLAAGQYTSTASATENNGADVYTWSLTINDLKTAASGIDLTKGATVTVIYKAHLTEEAIVTGATGTDIVTNNNKVNLEYSNQPDANGTGLGKTEDDTVWVFTYKVDNTKYKNSVAEANKLPGAGFTLYKDSVADANVVNLIWDANKKAYRPATTTEAAVQDYSAEITSRDETDVEGQFNIIGLDTGTYVLKETTTPTGYTTAEDITITIAARHSENASTAGADLTLAATNTSNSVIDKEGNTLPTTGGIGTTIFYVLGSVLVVGAAVLLITKRRMSR